MLMLVHPRPAGQATDPPKRRKCARSPSLSLTAEETKHLRAALRNTIRAYGGAPVLAQVMGVPAATLYSASKRAPSGALAIRLAQAAGVSVEAVLGGKLSAMGRCKACGARIGDRPAVAAGGAS